MRTRLALPQFVALMLAVASAPRADVPPGGALVVALAPEAGDAAALHAGRARLATRFEALGLKTLGTLADGLPPPARTTAAVAAAMMLDPTRVLLLAAGDSAAAGAAAAALAGAPGVAWAEPVRTREAVADAFPDDPYFASGRQWALENRGAAGPFHGVAGADIGARAAWAVTTGSADVLLAVADTGIDPAHPEFVALLPDGRPRLLPGLDVSLAPISAIVDSFGHGTLVAGVMAARTNEGAHADSLGIAGVCGGDGLSNPGCRLLPIKITQGSRGTTSSYVIARAALAAAAMGARAMNLSFAGGASSRLERLALHDALLQGCVVVCAAGNRGFSTPTAPQYPAAYAADGLCIQVGASDASDQRSVFSSYGPGLDLVAPGENIWTTYMTYPSAAGRAYDGYVMAAGTSFAAPHVTGTVGLLAAARPGLTENDIQNVLRVTAHDIGAPGWDAPTAWGRLDAAAALAAVSPHVGLWHGEAAATQVESTATGTFILGDTSVGEIPSSWEGAEQFDATVTVTPPDSFLPPLRAWARVGGTTTARGGMTLPYLTPWAEVVSLGDRSFALRGHLYRTPADSGVTNAGYLPVSPAEARFGFTVMARMDRAPTLRVTNPAPGAALRMGDSLAVTWEATDADTLTAFILDLVPEGGTPVPLANLAGDAHAWSAPLPCAPAGPASLRVTACDDHGARHDRTSLDLPVVVLPGGCAAAPAPAAARWGASPNPFRSHTWIATPWPGRLRIVDVSGREVARRELAAGTPGFAWDGRDARGARLPPGLYFARLAAAGRRLDLRLVHLD